MLTTFVALSVALFTTSIAASAGEQTITLAVQNMACVVCAYNVKKSLESVSGVLKVRVALKEKIAVIVYDDAKADVQALIGATARAGFSSAPKS
jgi:periplasmic mercuric ion binding protein